MTEVTIEIVDGDDRQALIGSVESQGETPAGKPKYRRRVNFLVKITASTLASLNGEFTPFQLYEMETFVSIAVDSLEGEEQVDCSGSIHSLNGYVSPTLFSCRFSYCTRMRTGQMTITTTAADA